MGKATLPRRPAEALDVVPAERTGRKPKPLFVQLLTPVASLRLTVVLFVLSLALVFFGTLAQIDNGNWTVVERYFRSLHVWVPFQLLVQFGQVFFGVPRDMVVSGSFPFPGGWLLGGLLLANLLAAHAVRFRLTWKRSGILTIHAGLIAMMLGELITGLYAVEAQMQIDENGSSNYVLQTRYCELAIVDSSGAEKDKVVVIPQNLLLQGGRIQHEALPCDVVVQRYMVNSRLEKTGADNDPGVKATAGLGLDAVAVEMPEVSGTSSKQTVETPSAYVTFQEKGGDRAIGTYLVSLRWAETQPVRVGDKTYHVALRFKRTYKPYSVHLYDFRFDRYMGTNTPKNFSSHVRLVDQETGEDREAVIRMNEPLTHRGDVFYQQGFDEETEKSTVLQVVNNPGRALPYISCAVVSLGMLLHFGINLVQFLQRRVV